MKAIKEHFELMHSMLMEPYIMATILMDGFVFLPCQISDCKQSSTSPHQWFWKSRSLDEDCKSWERGQGSYIIYGFTKSIFYHTP